VLAAVTLALFAVGVGALLFGTYGYGMFVVSPFVIGAVTGYLANRRGDIGGGATARLVFVGTTLGGIALIVAALEGAVCLVMASPLGLMVALLGGLFGRAAAVRTQGSAANALVGFALVPMVFASEQIFPGGTTFATEETIEVAAPPAAVWRAVVDMDEIATPPALPFRLGVAYPRRGIMVGEGVGATRLGVFSTGVARERVTAWEPGRLLAFAVLSEPPAMRELSPYDHVHAPHVVGYFRTLTTSFALAPLDGGRTRIVERTEHALDIDPLRTGCRSHVGSCTSTTRACWSTSATRPSARRGKDRAGAFAAPAIAFQAARQRRIFAGWTAEGGCAMATR
jgi:hypothetical protein